jgi:formate dehydrogenase iron-sulfur subunit
MAKRIYVPRDTAAIAVGADEVAVAIAEQAQARGIEIDIVRNGSRGLLWLETLVEVETAAGRIAYGPVQAEDVAGLFEAGWLDGNAHPLHHGPTAEIAYLKNQERLTFARVGIIDPLSLEDYQAHDGFKGLRKALRMQQSTIVEQVVESGLRGRGGAAFPTGIKWKTVLATPAAQKYIVCNADEGDSGTFSDRLLMEGDPYTLIEGMAIAGIAVGASYGYIYVRSEYPYAIETLSLAIAQARQAGWLGKDIQGSGLAFDLEVRTAAGAIFAVKKRRCWKAWRANAGWYGPNPRCPPSKACSASLPSSTTSFHWPRFPSFWTRAQRSTGITAWAVRAAPCLSS